MIYIFLTPDKNIVESYVKIDSITNDVNNENIDINFNVSSKSIYNNSIEANKVLINDETLLPIDFFSDCTKYIYQDSKFLLRPHLEFVIDEQYILKQLVDEVVVPLNKIIPIEVHYKDPDNINFKFDYIKLKDKAEFLEIPSQLEMIDKIATFNIFSPFPGVAKLRAKDNRYLCHFKPLIVRFKYVSI